MPIAVAIVVDREAGAALRRLVREWHLWIVDSDANRSVVEQLWKSLGRQGQQEMRVTIGDRHRQPNDGLRCLEEMLPEVIEHFPSVAKIGVLGIAGHDVETCGRLLAEEGFASARDDGTLLQYFRSSELLRTRP